MVLGLYQYDIGTEILDWDVSCTLPVPHYVYLCESLLPKCLFDGTESRELYRKLAATIQPLVDKYSVSGVELIIGGDPVDGFCIPGLSRSSTDSSHLRVLLILPDACVGNPGKYVIQTQENNFDFNLVTQDDQPVDSSIFDSLRELEKEVVESVSDVIKGRCKFEVQCALRCCWPQALAWAEQQHGWLSKEIVDKVKQSHCHVVSVEGPNSKQPAALWRYAFDGALHDICDFITPVLRQAYCIVKLLLDEELSYPRLLTAQHLRMLMYQAMDKWPENFYWDTVSLPKIVYYFLQELMCCLAKCYIPHFFLNINTLPPVLSDEVVQTAIQQLVKVRQAPLKFIINFFTRVNVEPGLTCSELVGITEPILRDASSQPGYDQLPASVLNHIVPSARTQVAALAAASLSHPAGDQLMKRAFYMTEFLCTMWKLVTKAEITVMDLGLQLVALQMKEPIRAAIALYEYILEMYGTRRGSQLNNLACLYHQYLHTLPEDQQQEYVTKTKALFEESFITPEKDGSMYTNNLDYCTFLCRMQLYNDAECYLKKSIGCTAQNLSITNSYGESEAGTVDEHLQQEIFASPKKKISVAHGIYARYLLIQTMLAREKQESHNKNTSSFNTKSPVCQQYEKTDLDANMVGKEQGRVTKEHDNAKSSLAPSQIKTRDSQEPQTDKDEDPQTGRSQEPQSDVEPRNSRCLEPQPEVEEPQTGRSQAPQTSMNQANGLVHPGKNEQSQGPHHQMADGSTVSQRQSTETPDHDPQIINIIEEMTDLALQIEVPEIQAFHLRMTAYAYLDAQTFIDDKKT